jgi:DNA-binding FadR family transcriptional regulator
MALTARPTGLTRPATLTPIAPNDRRRLHGSIAHDLAVAIVSGRHRPGDVLPNEDMFSQKLSVSRTAYREAVRILASKGLVESRPKTGTRIRERRHWNFLDPDVLAWTFEAEPDKAFVTELFELRQIVEPAAAALAAVRRTPEDLEAMRHALAAMRQDTLATDRGRQADLEFHHAVLVASHNEPLVALSSGIGATIRFSTQFKQREGLLQRDAMPEHWQVFEAIEQSDADAARARMSTLVALAFADMKGTLRSR